MLSYIIYKSPKNYFYNINVFFFKIFNFNLKKFIKFSELKGFFCDY